MFIFLKAAAEGGEHHVLLPSLPEIFWSSVILIILFIAFLKYLYPKYCEIMDERATRIQEGLDLAEKVKSQVAQADKEVAKQLKEAKEEAAQIRSEAQSIAKDIMAKAREDASAEADRIVAQANRQIEAQRQAAEISLRTELGMLAAELAEKIVGEELKNKEASKSVVDRFLDDLDKETKAESVN